jgi:protein-tyrosine phosphatase
MTQTPAVLFVCLGNICRSPLAEAAFRQAADRAGLTVTVDLAGRAHGMSAIPDPRARAQGKAHGIDMSGYKARQVVAEDFTRFTHVFALDRANLSDLSICARWGHRRIWGCCSTFCPGIGGNRWPTPITAARRISP